MIRWVLPCEGAELWEAEPIDNPELGPLVRDAIETGPYAYAAEVLFRDRPDRYVAVRIVPSHGKAEDLTGHIWMDRNGQRRVDLSTECKHHTGMDDVDVIDYENEHGCCLLFAEILNHHHEE